MNIEKLTPELLIGFLIAAVKWIAIFPESKKIVRILKTVNFFLFTLIIILLLFS